MSELIEGINFKKIAIALAIIAGGIWYVSTHYDLQDVLKNAEKYPDPEKAAKIEYFVGWNYFMRAKYPEAEGAFLQMLTNHPTCQYAPLALYRLGYMYQENRRLDKARHVYELHLKHFPDGAKHDLVEKKYEVIRFRGDAGVAKFLDPVYEELEEEEDGYW